MNVCVRICMQENMHVSRYLYARYVRKSIVHELSAWVPSAVHAREELGSIGRPPRGRLDEPARRAASGADYGKRAAEADDGERFGIRMTGGRCRAGAPERRQACYILTYVYAPSACAFYACWACILCMLRALCVCVCVCVCVLHHANALSFARSECAARECMHECVHARMFALRACEHACIPQPLACFFPCLFYLRSAAVMLCLSLFMCISFVFHVAQ